MKSTTDRSIAPWLMLVSRSLLFFGFQGLIAAALFLSGHVDAWGEAPRWWPFQPIFTNTISVLLLARLFYREGSSYWDMLRFSRATVKKDLLWLFGSMFIGLPVAMAPMNNLAVLLFGDAMTPIQMMFRPLPGWALAISFLFPLTIAFAELPTYFGYVMPRLAKQLKNGWAAWIIAAFFLGAQHCFLPFIADWRFLFWRLGMYMPFALFIGLLLKFRPQLLPYCVIIHALMDISAVLVYFML